MRGRKRMIWDSTGCRCCVPLFVTHIISTLNIKYLLFVHAHIEQIYVPFGVNASQDIPVWHEVNVNDFD